VVTPVHAGGGPSEFQQSMTLHPLVHHELPHHPYGLERSTREAFACLVVVASPLIAAYCGTSGGLLVRRR
jgi:hypothetical protein